MNNSKKIGLLAALLMLAQFCFSQNPVAYMDKISREFNKISKETWDYVSAVAHNKKARQIESQRRDMLNANRSALSRIKNMQPYNGDASYRDSIVKYLEMSFAVLNNDFSKIVDMEEIAEQSYDAMEAYMMAQEKANEKLDAAGEVASNAERSFAAKNNITLQENSSETSEKLDKANEVFKYYNKIYLIFFKPYKQEMYLIDAQNKSDVNAMKQNQEALGNLSKEAREKLKVIEPYKKNNNSLKNTCNNILDFYVLEAETKTPVLIDFFLKKEKFDKIRTTMEGKGNKASKQEIDEYNAAVNEFNKASAEYNRINQDLNNKRNKLLEDWNNSVSKFLDRNVSKKK